MRAKVYSDKEAFFKWMRELCENVFKPNSQLEPAILEEFYATVVVHGGKEFELLPVEGFACIQAMFMAVNEKRHSLIKVLS